MSNNLTPEVFAYLHAQKEAGKSLDDILGLEDFSSTLETVILDRLAALDEPVFTNPKTGQAASSVFAVLDALDRDYAFTPSEIHVSVGHSPLSGNK